QVLARGAAALAQDGRHRPRALDGAAHHRGRASRPHRLRERAGQGQPLPHAGEERGGGAGQRSGEGARVNPARDREVILVIEDDSSISRGLKMNLEVEGYTVLVAEDGEKGLALAYDEHPDLILLDVMLPKMNGYEVCKEIRRRRIDVPIIILSAKSAEIDR